MEVLLALAAVALLALLLVPEGLLTGAAPPPGPPAHRSPVEPPAGPGLLSAELVQRRLAALADELERLDDDPHVFAKGFRTTVARSAYEALLADAAALRDQDPWGGRAGGADVTVELL